MNAFSGGTRRTRLLVAAVCGVAATVLIGPASSGLLSKPVQAASPQLIIGVIGDYGICHYDPCSTTDEQAVADLVHSWNPNLIWTVGDNSYITG